MHMAVGSYVEQIMALEAQKQELMKKAKDEALSAAEKAIADLNNLGFHYQMVLNETRGTASKTARASTSTRTRTGGASDTVLEVLRAAPQGLSRGAVLEQMNAHDTKSQTSITNSLSNLKKKGQLTLDGGIYKAV